MESGNVDEVHARASAITESISGRKVTRQTVNILPRIRELDVFLQHHSEWRSRVHEVHPELSFRAMAGQSMEHGKKSMEGRQEREAAIRSHLGDEPIHLARAAFKHTRARDDDVLDAAGPACGRRSDLRKVSTSRFPTILSSMRQVSRWPFMSEETTASAKAGSPFGSTGVAAEDISHGSNHLTQCAVRM